MIENEAEHAHPADAYPRHTLSDVTIKMFPIHRCPEHYQPILSHVVVSLCMDPKTGKAWLI